MKFPGGVKGAGSPDPTYEGCWAGEPTPPRIAPSMRRNHRSFVFIPEVRTRAMGFRVTHRNYDVAALVVSSCVSEHCACWRRCGLFQQKLYG